MQDKGTKEFRSSEKLGSDAGILSDNMHSENCVPIYIRFIVGYIKRR